MPRHGIAMVIARNPYVLVSATRLLLPSGWLNRWHARLQAFPVFIGFSMLYALLWIFHPVQQLCAAACI